MIRWHIYRMPVTGGAAERSPNDGDDVRNEAQFRAEDLSAHFPTHVFWIQPEIAA